MSAVLAPIDDGSGWLADAGAEWHARHPLPKRGTEEGDRVCWSFGHTCAAFDDASMARALVAMGLRRVAVIDRGDVSWWQPDYFRASIHSARDGLARLNRFIRDSRVFAMRDIVQGAVIPPPDVLLMIDVDAGDGAWRTASGGAEGEDFISLGAFCWRITRGAAALRLAKLSGYRRLPHVGDLGR